MPINQLNNGDSGLTARTIINDLVSNVNNGSSGSYTGSFSGSFIGNLVGQADVAAIAVVALNYAETDPVFTAKESTLITTSSFNAFISEYNLWTGSATSQFAGTASFINLIPGPGIDINGLVITASVRSVNAIFPTNGNIAVALSSTQTGTSASLVISSSGAITSSLADGLVWIISGDPTPENNGDVYIWNSGSSQWLPIAPLDQSAGDARYLMLTPQSSLTGSLDLGGNDIINLGLLIGTASWAQNAISSISASFLPVGTYQITASQALTASQANSASFINLVAGPNITINYESNGIEISGSVSSIPGGQTYDIQFNSESILNGSSNFTFNNNTNTLLVSGSNNNGDGFVTIRTEDGYEVTLGSKDLPDNVGLYENNGGTSIAIYDYGNNRYIYGSAALQIIRNHYNGDDAVFISSNSVPQSASLVVGGNVFAESYTGSLLGTASNAESSSYSISSSIALTASYALNAANIDTGSLINTSSFNNFTGSVVTTSSFNNFTGSVVTTSSFNNFTGSVVTTSSFNNFTGSVVTTSSFNSFTSSINSWTGSSTSQFAGTASHVNLVAGPGITINGLIITSSVRSVNGSFPDSNGNISTALSSTKTGTSASLVASSSGAITSSLTDGLIWIISNDPTPANNGDVYIWNSGSSQWYPIATLDQAAGDARYLMLNPQSALLGDLDLGGNNILNVGNLFGTASWANNSITSSYALTASYINGNVAAGGPESSIQFKSSGVLSGSSRYIFDSVNNEVILTGSLVVRNFPATRFNRFDTDTSILFQNPSQLSGYGQITPWNGGYFQIAGVSANGLRLYGSGAPVTIDTNGSPIYIQPNGASSGQVYLSGSLYVTESLYLPSITLSSSQQILTINTSSGQVNYIPSSNLTILSASYASTASVTTSSSYAVTASYVLNSISSSFATTSSYALNSNQAISSSFATTSSYALTAQTAFIANQSAVATFATSSATASFITASNVYGPYGSNSILSASFALTSSIATSSSYALSSSFAVSSSRAISSSYALSSSFATSSSFSITASYALNAASSTINTSSLVTTSSFNSFTGSVITTSSFNNFTGSVVTTSSFNSFTGSIVTTSSFNSFTSSINSWTGSSTSQFAGTASYINLIAGPGITINGLRITSSVRTVNGSSPDSNGNIAISLSSTKTGTSSSLVASSSGAITSSLADGLIWIISGDPISANNGDTYIWNSGSTQWLQIAPLDQAAGDARYLMLNPTLPLVGNLNLGGNNILNVGTLFGTASYVTGSIFTSANPANRAITSLTASYVNGNIFTSTNQALSASYAISSSNTLSSSFAISSSFALSSSRAISSSNAVSSSYALSSSFAISSSFALSSSRAISSSFATTASHALNAGITILNNTNNRILTATGFNNVVEGESSLTFDGSTLNVVGRVNASTGFTGSLLGTASFAVSSSRTVSSSYALTASYALNGGGGSSPIPVSNQSTQITSGVTSFNFTGNGVTATAAGNAVTVNIPGVTGPASTVNSINTFWELATTTTYTDYLVRAFDTNTTTGGGYFRYYNVSNTNITNIAGIRIKTNTSIGYWERVYTGAIQVDWFGVKNSPNTLASFGITQGVADARYGTSYDGTSLINVTTDTYDYAAIQYAFKIAELPGFGAIEFTNRKTTSGLLGPYYMNRGAYLPRFQTNSAGAKLAESFFDINGKGCEIRTTPSNEPNVSPYSPTRSTTYSGCTFTPGSTTTTITIPNISTPSSILGIGKTVTSLQFAGPKTVTGFSIVGSNTILTVDGVITGGTNSLTVTAPVALFDRICPSQFYALDQGWVETRFHISNFQIYNNESNFGDVSCAIRLGPSFGSHIHDMEIHGFNKIIWCEFCLNTKIELVQFNYLDYGIFVDYGIYWGGNNSNSQSNITLIKQCRGYGQAGSPEKRILTLSGTSAGTNSCTITLDGITYGPGYIDLGPPLTFRNGFTLPLGPSDTVATSLVNNNNTFGNINYLLFGQNYTIEPDLQGWTVSKPAANQIEFVSNLRGPQTGSYSFNGGGSGITGLFTQTQLGTQNSITPFFVRASYDCEISNCYCEGSAPKYAVYFDTAASTVVKNFKILTLGVETPCTEASIFMRAGDGNYEIDSVSQLNSKNFLTFINISGNPKLDISRIISFNYPAYMNFNDPGVQVTIGKGDDFYPPWDSGITTPSNLILTSGSNIVANVSSLDLGNILTGSRVADVNNNATLSIPQGAIVSSKGASLFTMHFKNGQPANATITRPGNAQLYVNRVSGSSDYLRWSHPYSPFVWRRGQGSYVNFENQIITGQEFRIPGPLWRAGGTLNTYVGPNAGLARLVHIPNIIRAQTGQPYNGL